MIFLAYILAIFSAAATLLAAIALLKAKDVFVMLQIIKIMNFYILPLGLLALGLDNFSSAAFLKTVLIIFLNILTSSIICHLLAKRAIANKITPDADFKKDLL